MPTKCFGKLKKKKVKQDLVDGIEDVIEDGIEDNLEEVTAKNCTFKKFKKSSLKKGQKALAVAAQTSTKALSTAKTSFEKGADLVINNQEEIERAASLAFPGAGLAAKAAIEGVKVANRFVSKIPNKLPDKVQEKLDKLQDIDKVSTDLENKLAVEEDKSTPDENKSTINGDSKPSLEEDKLQTNENKNTTEDTNITVIGEDQKPSVEKN